MDTPDNTFEPIGQSQVVKVTNKRKSPRLHNSSAGSSVNETATTKKARKNESTQPRAKVCIDVEKSKESVEKSKEQPLVEDQSATSASTVQVSSQNIDIKCPGGQISINVESSSTLLNVRKQIGGHCLLPKNGDFFFEVDGSLVSKKMESASSMGAIVEEGASISVTSRSALLDDTTEVATQKTFSKSSQSAEGKHDSISSPVEAHVDAPVLDEMSVMNHVGNHSRAKPKKVASKGRRTRTMIIEEEKKQILAHKRKLLLYVRECRRAAEERMQQLTEEECKQLELVSVENVQRASSALEESTSRNPMPSQVTSDDSTITIYKPTKDTRVGLVLAQLGTNYLTVRSVAQDSLFIGSLKAGMVIKSVNGVVPASFAHGFGKLKNSEGHVVIVAGPPLVDSTEHARLVELPVHEPSQSVLKVAAQSDDQKQNDATVTFDGSIQSYLVDHKATKRATNKSPGSTSSIASAHTRSEKKSANEEETEEVAVEKRPQVDQTIVNVVHQSSPNTSSQDSKQFIARVKNTFAHQTFAYSNFLELAMKFKTNDLDTTHFARQVVSLFQGHNDLILGFFSFLPNDEDETESISCGREISVVMHAMGALEFNQIGHILYVLAGRISQILDTQIDQSGLRSILHSLHLQDSRFVALFPTVDSLRYELAAYFCMCKAFS